MGAHEADGRAGAPENLCGHSAESAGQGSRGAAGRASRGRR
jgi:hypothetical protein